MYSTIPNQTKRNATKQTELVRIEKVAPIGAFISIHKSGGDKRASKPKYNAHLTNKSKPPECQMSSTLFAYEREREGGGNGRDGLCQKAVAVDHFERDLFYGRENRKTEGERVGRTIIMASCKISQVSRCEMTFVRPFKFFSFSLYIFVCVRVFVHFEAKHRLPVQLLSSIQCSCSMFNPCSTITTSSSSTFSKEMKCCGCKKKKGNLVKQTFHSCVPKVHLIFFLFTLLKRLRLFAFPFQWLVIFHDNSNDPTSVCC